MDRLCDSTHECLYDLNRQDMYNDIEPEYYGVCDDENPLQLQAEKEAEEKRIQEAIQLYEHKQQIKEKEIQAIVSSFYCNHFNVWYMES
jgi:hypothetical protein